MSLVRHAACVLWGVCDLCAFVFARVCLCGCVPVCVLCAYLCVCVCGGGDQLCAQGDLGKLIASMNPPVPLPYHIGTGRARGVLRVRYSLRSA